MAGTELILAALAAGATAGVTNVASAAVSDASDALRGALKKLFKSQISKIALETDLTQDEEARKTIQAEIADTEADKNPEILSLAEVVLTAANSPGITYQTDLREAKGVQVGNTNIQTNNF